jgi:hypothetical protein
MSADTMHSSLFARTQKAGLFLSAVTVMKSMVGVGMLGLVDFFEIDGSRT